MEKNNNKPKLRFPGFTDPWEQRKLNEIADVLDGDRGNNYPNGNEFQERGHTLFLSASNVTTNGFMFDDTQYITEEKSNSMGNGKLLLDDIVLTSRGSIGHIAWYNKAILQQVPFARINSGMLILRSKDFVMPCFVAQFLKSPLGKRQIDLISFGSAQPQLTKKDVSNYVVSIPSDSNEQSKLGVFFDNIDNLITLHQRKLNHLQDKKKSLLQKMFPKNGEDFPELRFPGFTDPWEQRKFGELFTEYREKTIVENEDVLLSCAINGMFLNSELFSHQRGQSNIGYLKIKKYDLILSTQNLHLGNVNVNFRFEHGIISPAYKVFSTDGCSPEFVGAWVKKDDTKNFFLAATTEGASVCRKNIEWETLYRKYILVPKITEQEAIGTFFQNFDNLITLHQRKLNHLKEQKKALLQQMFI